MMLIYLIFLTIMDLKKKRLSPAAGPSRGAIAWSCTFPRSDQQYYSCRYIHTHTC